MEYTGQSKRVKVRINSSSGWLKRYRGQICDAIIYEPGVKPQIDTEQLNPPLPRWQSVDEDAIQIMDEGR